jgi:hypothetical protein
MKLVECRSSQVKDYIRFVGSVYKDIPNYKNNTDWTTKLILSGRSEFGRSAFILPVLVCDAERVVAACTFIHHANLPDYLQIAFFEAIPDSQSAVGLLIGKARDICQERNIAKICIGLNGHVNYGFGMLDDHFDSPVSFGDWYNPEYYSGYFAGHATKTYSLSSFRGETAHVDRAFLKKATERFCKEFSFRKADFRQFRREMQIYTDLNNRCFGNHPFYYQRSYAEDYELFSGLRLLIREENLIFAEADGQPAGFLLGYPDFNAFVPPGKTAGLGTVIKNRLFPGQIDKFKIVEMGVLPQYQQSAMILGLFDLCYRFAGDKYVYFESSWIWDENHESRACAKRLMDAEYKHFKVFVIEA